VGLLNIASVPLTPDICKFTAVVVNLFLISSKYYKYYYYTIIRQHPHTPHHHPPPPPSHHHHRDYYHYHYYGILLFLLLLYGIFRIFRQYYNNSYNRLSIPLLTCSERQQNQLRTPLKHPSTSYWSLRKEQKTNINRIRNLYHYISKRSLSLHLSAKSQNSGQPE